MDRVLYLVERERRMYGPVAPLYFETVHGLGPDSDRWLARAACVDRMLRLASSRMASEATVWAAARAFDRYMTESFESDDATMVIVALACFDACARCLDSEWAVSLDDYYHYAKELGRERCPPRSEFARVLRRAQLNVMIATDGQPFEPTPFDYVDELTPWLRTPRSVEGRGFAMLASGFLHTKESTCYTAYEVAVAAAALAKRKDAPVAEGSALEAALSAVPAPEMGEVQRKMMWACDQLFDTAATGFGRAFWDMQALWGAALQRNCR